MPSKVANGGKTSSDALASSPSGGVGVRMDGMLDAIREIMVYDDCSTHESNKRSLFVNVNYVYWRDCAVDVVVCIGL